MARLLAKTGTAAQRRFKRDVRKAQSVLRATSAGIETYSNTPEIRAIAKRTLVKPLKKATPKRTGAMRRSVGTRKFNKTLYVKVGKTKKVYYSHWVEFGTIFAPPHPFFFVTLARHRDAFVKEASKVIGKNFSARVNVKLKRI